MFTARAPEPSYEFPEPLAALLAGRPAEAVWVNALDGVTVRLPDEDAYLKWQPPGTRLPALALEEERLRWASRELALRRGAAAAEHPAEPDEVAARIVAARLDGIGAEGPDDDDHPTTVPRVLEHGADGRGEWLVTAALPGRSAVDPVWLARPEVAVPAIGRELRRLHESFDVERCPYDWSVEQRLRLAPPDVAPRFAEAPPVDRLVVCHGDACAPNTLLAEDGTGAGHVDLGALGIADRWADIAVAARSTEWNYGPGWERALVAGYGVPFDDERMRFYRELWDAE
ncbi:phosphotransferase [Arenivirga flava]|uniref:Phosphotransferase n=1 Tax=Arenivirga flava TaxID=1930060 RepID=A0AA37X843_9MICO|nr:phosphotransferase [Arenivirga flava]GMA27134.1 putative phosphotransferase [Arenivirga flava]